MIKMVIFDLDGTLVNTIGGIGYACNHVLESHGYASKPIEKYMNYVGNGLAMTMFKALPFDKKSSLIKPFEDEADFDHPELKGYVKELLDFYEINPTIDSYLYKDVDKVLNFLDEHHIEWAIHTNKQDSIAQDVADTFICPERYIGLRGPSESVPKKPDPKGSLDLIEMAKDICLKEVIYVGDTEVDIKTAKNLGVPIISVCYGFRNKEVLASLNPDYLVDTPLDIIKVLGQLI